MKDKIQKAAKDYADNTEYVSHVDVNGEDDGKIAIHNMRSMAFFAGAEYVQELYREQLKYYTWDGVSWNHIVRN